MTQRRAAPLHRAELSRRTRWSTGASRLMTGVVVVLLIMASMAGPAAAQDGGGDATTGDPAAGSTTSSTSTTTPTIVVDTTAPSSSTPPPDDSTDAAATPDSGQEATPTTASAEPTTSTAAGETTSSTDGSTSSVDPLIGEAPADEALDPNITVPPPSGAGTNVEFAPVPILWSNVREAEEKWANAVADRVSAISEVRSLRLRSKELTREREALEEATQQTIVDLVAATERLQHRAVRGFVQTSSGNPSSALLSDGSAPAGELSTEMFRSRELLVHQRKTKLVQAVVDVDQAGLGQLAALRESLGAGAIELVQRWSIVESSLRRAETAARELSVDIDQAKIELEAFKAGSDIYVDGVVFPIAGDYSVPLINSFGFPRMPGTPDAHSHQGIDIFAPRGTPLVAAERGVIGRIGNGRLGGLKFWLRGESGADWYYAHLDGFAPGLHNGQVVEAGELLGYVGNTGNAIGTPPHLHLEIHPNGGGAVNPYPLLKVVSDLDRKAFVEGTHPGFRYQPVVQGRPDDENPVAAATTVTTAGEQTPTTAGPEPSPSSRGTITESTAAESTTASTAPATSASIAPSITTPSSVASSTAAAAASESTATTAATSTKSGSGGGTGGETGS